MWVTLSWAVLGIAVGLRSSQKARDRILEVQANGRAFANGQFHTSPSFVVLYTASVTALYAGIAARFDGLFALLAYSVFVTVLVAHTFIDLDTHLLIRSVTTRATIVGVPLLFIAAPSRVFASAIGAVLMWAVLRLLLAMSRGGLGRGDVALAPFLGWFLGALSVGHVFIALVASFVIAGVVVGIALALRKVRRSTHVPFGPFLAVGSVITVFAGLRITDWWLG